MKINPSDSAAPIKKKKQPKKITPTYLHNSGLYYLQRYATSAENFRRVMMRKVQKSCRAHPDQKLEDCAALVDDLVKKFCGAGLLNDELYTQGLVNSLRRQGKSQKLILGKLHEKGIASPLAQQTLRTHDEDRFADRDAEFESALIFARKKRLGPYNKTPAPVDREARLKQQQKSLAAFARAGFSYDIARKILEMEEIKPF